MIICATSTFSGGMWLLGFIGTNDQEDIVGQAWSADSAELTVAVSPVMAPVFQEMANNFNSLDLRTPDDQKMTVWIVPVVPEKMVDDALGHAQLSGHITRL